MSILDTTENIKNNKQPLSPNTTDDKIKKNIQICSPTSETTDFLQDNQEPDNNWNEHKLKQNFNLYNLQEFQKNSISADETNTSDINNINLNSYENKIYSHNDKKQLLNRINNIKNKKCYIKIFSIIHNHKLKYTKNDNGIFFNLTILPNDILNIIENIVNYYENKINL